MLSASKDIAVNPEACLARNCHASCDDPGCQLCMPCLSKPVIKALHSSYRENQRKGEMLRLFPNGNYFKPELIKQFSAITQLSVKWFKEKCDIDKHYC